MPIQPTYPGVYIEEIPSGVRTITGVATSVAAFFGQTTEGPINKATYLSSYADFQRRFGPPHSDSELNDAIRLFFQNGGTECYVTRLIKKGTGQKASLIIKNEALLDVLKFTALEIGVWGNEIALEVDYNTIHPEQTFNLKIYRLNNDGTVKTSEEYLNCSMDPADNKFTPKYISQESKLVECSHVLGTDAAYLASAPSPGYSESRKSFTKNAAGRDALSNLLKESNNTYNFKIRINDSPFYEVSLKDAFATGQNEATVLSSIKTKINNALPAALLNKVDVKFVPFSGGANPPQLLRFVGDSADIKRIQIQAGTSADVSNVLMIGTDQGGIEKSRFSVLRPAPTGTFLDLSQSNTLANLPQNHFSIFKLDGNDMNLGIKIQTTAPADKWYKGYVDGVITDHDGVREKLAILASEINNASIGWQAVIAGSRLFLKKQSGLKNYSQSISTTPNDIVALFKANTRYYSIDSGGGSYQGATQTGIDGEAPDAASYKGSELSHTGFYALDLVDLFNLMIIPRDSSLTEDKYQSLWGPASTYCKKNRAFLLVDPPKSWSSDVANVTDPVKGIRKLRLGVTKDNAAVFYPNLMLNKNPIGPTGAIAGLMSRTDSERGVWKAPAGLDAELVSISDVEVNMTDMENGRLNKQGVNCIRKLPGGIVNWGARTMDGADDFGSEWKYIPIRRLALFLEESLFRGTKWVVFEPNDEPLWAKIRMNIRAFMMRLFRQGAFQGSTPDQAFFVKCDEETTPQSDRDLGIVNIEVGFAPLKPAEFVIIKIQQMAGDL